jgi:hypothetical protein
MRRKLGRNEIARQAHFLKAGPTEKQGRQRKKAVRQKDRLEEKRVAEQDVREKDPE